VSDDAIRFQAQVFKVQTLIDGGLRLTLDIGQITPETIVALFDAKQPGIVLECAAVAIQPEKVKSDRGKRRNTEKKEKIITG